MKDLLSILKGEPTGNRLVDLIRDGKFDEAIRHLNDKDIEEQGSIMYLGLILYAVKTLKIERICITEDKNECEQFLALVGKVDNTPKKWIFYQNQKTGVIEAGDDALIEKFPDNPIYRRLEELFPA